MGLKPAPTALRIVPMKAKKIEFPSGDLILEGIFALPGGSGPFPLVVVCHPHPLYGGTMYDNVVHAICEKLMEKEIAWLKFNFRGVGGSGGSFGGGIGEREDLRAAISFGEKSPGIDGQRIGVCGYSFGAMVALAVAVEDGRAKAAAGISPIIQPENLLDACTKPKMLVCGDQDEFVDVKALQRIFQKMPDPKQLAVYPGVNHFWGNEDEAMAGQVSRFFEKSL